MIQAQWGLKDQLLCDPAIWLCHNCGDCTTHARAAPGPGDVFGALRQRSHPALRLPRLRGPGWWRDPRALRVLFLAARADLRGHRLVGAQGPPDQVLEFASRFPLPVLEALFFAVSGLALVAFRVGCRAIRQGAAIARGDGRSIRGSFPPLLDIMTHERFEDAAKAEAGSGATC